MEPPAHGIFSPRPTSNQRQLLSQLNAFENELGFLLGECATINVMLNSLRNAFWSSGSSSESMDIQREVLIDYDEIISKVEKLERKLQLLEMEFRAAQQRQQYWFH
ncbi:hypothetical protein BDC45DRAFT_519655 [Circinella umbellata]|nr:hypothetical protein BDC45DRAFT_519655 [Circinella umbellata]